MIRTRFLVAAIGFAVLSQGAALAEDAVGRLHPVGEPYDVGKGLNGKWKDGEYKKAKDISGIACMPAAAGPRRCLVVNDENRGAQFITIDGRAITPGRFVDLIGETASAATLGAAPGRYDCSKGLGEFEDLDGEGVAYADPYFYVVGSHGCSRHGKQFKASAFILSRIRPGSDDTPPGRDVVETTYRLADALKDAAVVGSHFAHDLQTTETSNGLNVEGVAVVEGRLFAGLRAPSLDGTAYIVAVNVDELFAAGHGHLKTKPTLVEVKIGQGAGIRDLAVLPDKRLLLLTGPTRDGKEDYALFAIEPKPGGKVERLGVLAPFDGKDREGKAEGVFRLGPGRAIVLFDSLKDGGPREYKLAIP